MHGLSKNISMSINFDCVPNSNVEGGTERENPISLCGSIPTTGYEIINNCETPINSPGNYILNGNVDCDLIVSSSGVNINGNYCSLNGSINASGGSNNQSGHEINLSYITITGNVLSNGDDSITTLQGGNGGNISLIFSTIHGNVSSIGGLSTMDSMSSGGNGGTITIEDSIVLGSIYSKGGIGEFGVGFGGEIYLTNSTVTTISSEGNYSNGPWIGGAGGNISLTNSTATNLVASAGTGFNGDTGNGGNVTLTTSTVNSIITNGGDDGMFGNAGNGGNVIVNSSNVLSIISNGGNAAGGLQGNGGNVTFNPCPDPIPSVSVIGGINPFIPEETGENGTITPIDCHKP